jgi:hypothetical protein
MENKNINISIHIHHQKVARKLGGTGILWNTAAYGKR